MTFSQSENEVWIKWQLRREACYCFGHHAQFQPLQLVNIILDHKTSKQTRSLNSLITYIVQLCKYHYVAFYLYLIAGLLKAYQRVCIKLKKCMFTSVQTEWLLSILLTKDTSTCKYVCDALSCCITYFTWITKGGTYTH